MPSFPTALRAQQRRIIVAIGIGLGAGITAYAFLSRQGLAGDFFFVWTAARSLLAGNNPYRIIAVGPENPGNDVLLYPLPAILLVVPFAWLPVAVAGGLFLGISSALLAYALTRDRYDRLPIFLSAPFLMAVSLGQWSPLLTAAALETNLGFALAAKPNLGIAAWLYRPNVRAILIAGAFLVVSIMVLPTWPLDWLRNINAREEKFIPLLRIGGPALLLALIRWRRPDARLLLAMACVPQALFFYDQLILGLIPRSFRQALIFALTSFILLLGWFFGLKPGDYYVQKAIPFATSLYFVALLIVLWPMPASHGARATQSIEAAGQATSAARDA